MAEGGEEVVLKPPRSPVSDVASSNADNPSDLVEEMKERFITLDLLFEYKLLYMNHVHGIYVLPSPTSMHEWHGVIFVRSGPYRSGIFRFTIYIPDGFPRLRPMVKFLPKVPHPCIHKENGVLKLQRGFPFWEPSKHHIWHVVKFIADCFYCKDMWEDVDDLETFTRQAQSSAQQSFATIYNPNTNEGGTSIFFKQQDEHVFQDTLVAMAMGEIPQPPPEENAGLISSVTDQLWGLIGIR